MPLKTNKPTNRPTNSSSYYYWYSFSSSYASPKLVISHIFQILIIFIILRLLPIIFLLLIWYSFNFPSSFFFFLLIPSLTPSTSHPQTHILFPIHPLIFLARPDLLGCSFNVLTSYPYSLSSLFSYTFFFWSTHISSTSHPRTLISSPSHFVCVFFPILTHIPSTSQLRTSFLSIFLYFFSLLIPIHILSTSHPHTHILSPLHFLTPPRSSDPHWYSFSPHVLTPLSSYNPYTYFFNFPSTYS